MKTAIVVIAVLFCVETTLGGISKKKDVTDELLAQKIEKILASDNSNPKVEQFKQDLEKQIEYNFLRTLSALVVAGPVRVEKDQQEVLKLMKDTLNGDLNFKPVVDKMPLLLRENETKRFNIIVKTIGQRNGVRQFGGLQNVDKILDVASKINPKEVSTFLKEIPEIFEGVESIVDGVDEYFK